MAFSSFFFFLFFKKFQHPQLIRQLVVVENGPEKGRVGRELQK